MPFSGGSRSSEILNSHDFILIILDIYMEALSWKRMKHSGRFGMGLNMHVASDSIVWFCFGASRANAMGIICICMALRTRMISNSLGYFGLDHLDTHECI